jgi:hypothetical protein
VEDLDREVLAYLAQDLLVLLLDDLAGAVVWIDDVVTDLEVDALGLPGDVFQILDLRGSCLGDDALLRQWSVRVPDRDAVLVRSAGSGPRG